MNKIRVLSSQHIDFYKVFFEYCHSGRGTIFGRECRILQDYITTGYSGGGWDHHDSEPAPVFWPIEEATWLRSVKDSQVLYAEIKDFVRFLEANARVSDGSRCPQ